MGPLKPVFKTCTTTVSLTFSDDLTLKIRLPCINHFKFPCQIPTHSIYRVTYNQSIPTLHFVPFCFFFFPFSFSSLFFFPLKFSDSCSGLVLLPPVSMTSSYPSAQELNFFSGSSLLTLCCLFGFSTVLHIY